MMDFLSILKEIDLIARLSKRSPEEARVKLQHLLHKVEKAHESKGVDYLQQVLVGYGLGGLLENPPVLAKTTYKTSGAYESFFNEAIYQQILPLCQLAYLYETNGIPEEHAFKLSTLFSAENIIYAYLLNFNHDGNHRQHLVHDACLFDLPPPDACDFNRWKEIANRKNKRPEEGMLNPRFREILSHAPALERIERLGLEKAKLSKNTLNRELIKAKKSEIQKINHEYKKINSQTQEEVEGKTTQLRELASQRSQLRLELANLCAGMTLEDADILILQAFYEKYQSESNASHKLLITYGISEKEIATFHSLKRANDDMAIPNVVFDGAKIGHPGIYLKKLDTMSDKGAALAACLGKITNCCQYLGGAGSECAIHGITSPNGGFYVVCKGKAEHPSIEDPILAQSWTWRSKSGALCCDSIEANGNEHTKEITVMYRYFAHELCSNPDFNHFKVNRINTGAHGGITRDIASQAFPATTEEPIDYHGYRDSELQLLLADTSVPYLFYDEDVSSGLHDMIKKNTQHYLKSMFGTKSPLKENEPLKQTVYFLLSQPPKMLALLKKISGAREKQLDQLIDVNRCYIKALENRKIDVTALQQGAYLKATYFRGESALYLATTRDPASLKVILEAYPESERLLALNMKDIYGRTVLYMATKNTESLNVILKSLPKSERLLALKITNTNGNTVLQSAATNPESLKIILGLYPESERLLPLKITNKDGETLLHNAATTPASLKVILESLIESERLKALMMANDIGNTVLHKTATTPASLTVILESLPKSERLLALMKTNENGNTVLQYAATTPASLKVILESLPESERLVALMMANENGDTVLQYAATNPESIKIILESLPESERPKALMMANENGDTILHYEDTAPELLKVILELLPESERLKALMLTNKNGEMVLHYTATNPESIKIILESLPESERPRAAELIKKSTTKSIPFKEVLEAIKNQPNGDNSGKNDSNKI